MASKPQGHTPSTKPGTSTSPTKTYLLAYNALSFLGWAAVLGRVVLLLPLVGPENVYGGVGELVKVVQTFAVLEILHCIFGLSSLVFYILIDANDVIENHSRVADMPFC
jgi:hypothetical protein